MPADGPPEPVEFPQGAAAQDLQVRVFPVEPHPGADPVDLLAGFLDASNADEANYSTALKYLTADARKRWRPDAGVAVLASKGRTPPKGDGDATDITVTGSQVAQLDAKHTYRNVSDLPYRQKFTFVKETQGPDKGEWRIDQLPDGLIVDLTNFNNGYRAVHRYFYAAGDPSVHAGPPQVLVPDPIYLRRRIDPLTAAAQALAEGPSDWLSGAVETAFLHGVEVVGPVSMSDSQVAAVKVSAVDFASQPLLCRRMADQLFYTLADQQPKRQLERLDLSGAKGSCSVDASQTQQIAPGVLAGGDAGAQQYFQLDGGQLMQTQGDSDGKPVLGTLGKPGQPGRPNPAAIAVRRDGGAAAVVGADRRTLTVVVIGDGDRTAAPLVTVHPAQPDQGLASPSWDGRQNLWVVDRDPVTPRVLMVRGETVVTAQIDGLNGLTVRELRISSDGTRVALRTVDASGASALMLGLVVHSGSPVNPQVAIVGLRPLAPKMSEIASFSWADTDQLLVLGNEPNKLQQLHYIGTDGSQTGDTPQPGGDSMLSVSASETLTGGDLAPPVLAVSSNKQIYRLLGNQWREVTGQHHGAFFSYPG
ncbi:LpqB family beta-propeller domain-containing protein [Kitasatospora kazusensis]|uniref:LpqB family beta-propeller domain-containing protein n=2 Tax=Kitasatospora kazusensis TaxID=407974 RepID=A0ABP5LZY6_9ACTN